MIDDSTDKRSKHLGEPVHRDQMLLGKAVLLIGNDTAVMQNLVRQLAKKGADITLLCWQIPVEVARRLNETVQSLGRQFILIERAENQRFSVEQLIHNIITRWGYFDFFIDVSARAVTAVSNKDKADEETNEPIAWPPSNWQLTWTVLEEMART